MFANADTFSVGMVRTELVRDSSLSQGPVAVRVCAWAGSSTFSVAENSKFFIFVPEGKQDPLACTAVVSASGFVGRSEDETLIAQQRQEYLCQLPSPWC